MANWSDLKSSVASIIKTNGAKEITGQLLQNVLNNIISNVGLNSTFAGIATPETNPGTPDGNVFYLATTAGTYSNFNGIVIEAGEAVILEWKGSWVKKDSGFATHEKLTETGREMCLNGVLNNSGTIRFLENNPNGTIRYNYNLCKNKEYKISMIPNNGEIFAYIILYNIDGTKKSILTEGFISFMPTVDAPYFDVIYGAEMTASSVEINIETTKDVINYAPEYSQFNEVFKKFGMIESVEYLSYNCVRLKESRGSYAFGFKINISNSPFKIGDTLCVGFKHVILNDGSGYINFACYDETETRVSNLQVQSLATSELISLTLPIVDNTKYIVAFIQGSAKCDVTVGECILIRGNTIEKEYEYSRNILCEKNITLVNYAPYYPNFKKALLPNDMNVSITSNNNAIIKSDTGAKVFGFQVKLKDTPFSEGDWITARVKDVVLNSGSGYLMLLFYDSNETRLGEINSINITTSDYLELYREIPQNTDLIVVRFQSQGALEAEVGEFIFTKDNVKGDNIQWIRNEIISGGVSSSTNQTVYVNGDLGDDVNNGSKQMPMKTLSEAINKAGVNANIVLLGNVYDSLNIKQNDNQKSLRIIGEQGVTNRIILGEKITSATLIQEDVYQYNIASFPSESTSYCLWQHDIPDSTTAITESEKHPLQRGKTYRLDSTKLSRVSSLNEVKLSNNPVFYYDKSNGILYFRVVSGSKLADNPIYLPTPNPAIYGNDGNVKVEFTNIEVWYSNFDLSNCNGGVINECSAKFGVNGGFSWKDCNALQFIRCEACGVHDFDNIYGDGFSVGSTISEPTTDKCTTAVMYDCWSHDNHDDGYSDHLNNETTIDGGLFEYNDGGVTTSYGSKDIVRNVYARNNTEAGITVYGGSAEGTESFVSNCICENNSPYNFSVVNGGARKTKGTFVNCISINADNTGYYANGSNVEMIVINCYDNGSPNAKSANVSSKNCNIV